VPPTPGQNVALQLSDGGRAALAVRAGPELDQLRGTLVRWTDTALTIAMKETRTIRGGVTPWTGESLTVSPALIVNVRTQRLDRTRTALLATIATTAAVAFIAGNGFGSGRRTETEPITPPSGPGPASVRISLVPSFRSH